MGSSAVGATSPPGAGSLPDAAMPASASSSEVQLDSSRLSAAFGAALGAVDDEESGAAGTAAAIGVGGGGRGVVVDLETAAADIPGVNAGTPGSPSISPDLSAPAVGGISGSVGVDASGVDVGADAGAAESFLLFLKTLYRTKRVVWVGCPLLSWMRLFVGFVGPNCRLKMVSFFFSPWRIESALPSKCIPSCFYVLQILDESLKNLSNIERSHISTTCVSYGGGSTSDSFRCSQQPRVS